MELIVQSVKQENMLYPTSWLFVSLCSNRIHFYIVVFSGNKFDDDCFGLSELYLKIL